MPRRLHALDWMRGIVMILMATDHASAAFNAHRFVTDSVFFYVPGTPLPALEFLYRWAGHLCAPTFLFLAGSSLALSVHRRRESGVSESRIDRDLLIRGLLIFSVDLILISWIWFPGSILLQVMYAIGLSMILMIPLRRLPTRVIVALALLVIVSAELFLNPSMVIPNAPLPIAKVLLFGTGIFSPSGVYPPMDVLNPPRGILLVGYPLLPWWAMMALGWAFGRWILRRRGMNRGSGSLVRPMFMAGLCSLAAFGLVRGINSYGNMHLLREGPGLLQWLHASKYPPSISYIALELGLMALILAALLRLQERREGRVGANGAVLVFGQTAFFFYIAHIVLLEMAARGLGMHHREGLGVTLIAALAVLVVLYPLCRWYRAYKVTHPDSWVRFI